MLNSFLVAEHDYTQIPDLSIFHTHTHENYELFLFHIWRC